MGQANAVGPTSIEGSFLLVHGGTGSVGVAAEAGMTCPVKSCGCCGVYNSVVTLHEASWQPCKIQHRMVKLTSFMGKLCSCSFGRSCAPVVTGQPSHFSHRFYLVD